MVCSKVGTIVSQMSGGGGGGGGGGGHVDLSDLRWPWSGGVVLVSCKADYCWGPGSGLAWRLQLECQGEVEEEEQELNHPLLTSHLLDKVGLVEMSEGTLRRSDNFTQLKALCSWVPVNFLILQNGGPTAKTMYRSLVRDLFLSEWR